MVDIEKSSGNIYEDLGFDDAPEMQVKASLAMKIGEIIKRRKMNQTEAATVLGLTQPKVSGMLRVQFRGISEVKMIDCLNRLGRDVEIVVRKHQEREDTGTTSVVFA